MAGEETKIPSASLILAENLWEFSGDEVNKVFKEDLLNVVRRSWEWIATRNLLWETHDARQREFFALAAGEGRELRESILKKEKEGDQMRELGDALTYLSYVSDNISVFDEWGNVLVNIGTYWKDEEEQYAENIIVKELDILNEAAERYYHEGDLNQIQPIEKEVKMDEQLIKVFDLLCRYSLAKKWSLNEVIEKTIKKNNDNWPEEFFMKGFSPFNSSDDAVNCASLLRHRFKDDSLKVAAQSRMASNFLWSLHSDKQWFGDWVFRNLKTINDDVKESLEDRIMAGKLLWAGYDDGSWQMSRP